jgi:hypothetical protein
VEDHSDMDELQIETMNNDDLIEKIKIMR